MQCPSKYVVIPLTLMAMTCASAHAGAENSFASTDFSLRFPAALAKYSSYGDVAGSGGASAGSRYGSGINPASLDWMPLPRAVVAVSPQLSHVRFERGASLRIATVSATASNSSYGTFQPSYARVSNNGSMSGDFLLADGNVAQLQWGKKLDNGLAIGANLNRSEFNTRAGFGGLLAADDDSVSHSVRGGILWAASSRLLAGLVVDVSSGRSAAMVFDPACSCAGRFDSSSRAAAARLGMSYEYAPQSAVYADYLLGRYRNEAASMISRTAMLGAEHAVLPGLSVRAGVAYELRGAWGKSIGIGITPSKNVSIEFALQRDMFPELQPEFGRATLANLSMSIAF